MAKFHLVTGNHKSSLGIEDIHLMLLDVLGNDLTTGTFAEKSRINFVIEDFASQDFTSYVLNSDFKFCLILTEFMNLGYSGKIFINKFGRKANPIVLFSKDLVFAIVRNLKDSLPFRLKLKCEEFIYWNNREIGLRRILKHGDFYGVFCLHPAIEVQARKYMPKLSPSSFFTLFPRLNNVQREDVSLDIPIVSFGNKNKYRKREISKFNNTFPSKVLQPKFEKGSSGNNSVPIGKFIDLYFRNSKSWKYLSPVRFWRTLRKGSFIVYFGEEVSDHPINKCAIRVDKYKDFAKSIESLSKVVKQIRNEIEIYDDIAKENNNRSLIFLNNLDQISGAKSD
jgi:hypothetical protein